MSKINLRITNDLFSIFTLVNDISEVIFFVICSPYVYCYFTFLVMILHILFDEETIRTFPW